MADPALLNYVTESRNAGMDESSIKQILLNAGWQAADVESAMAPSASVTPSSDGNKISYVLVGVLSIVLLATGYFASAKFLFHTWPFTTSEHVSVLASAPSPNKATSTPSAPSALVNSTSTLPVAITPPPHSSSSTVPTKTPPAPSPASPTIDSCRTITTPGEYSLSGDITNTKSEPCIKIQNVSNVSLDCQNHTITSKNENYNIYVQGASDFKINNCKLVSSINVPIEKGTQSVLKIEDSKRGNLDNDTIAGNFAGIKGSSFVTVRKSTFTNQFIVYKSTDITIEGSTFSSTATVALTFQGGSHNSAISNFIDGKSDGVLRGGDANIGADDGIVIRDESGDLIQGNTLQNFYDCAIENIGYMFDTKIIGNKATNAGVCFLGGWYWSSVKGIIVKDNVVTNTPNLFSFFRSYPLKQGEQYVYFQNNLFENNKLSDPKLDTSNSFASRFLFDGSAVPLQNHVFGNNILKNNDFTKLTLPLRLTPATIVTDGGGNICSGAEGEGRGGGDPVPFNCN